MGTISSTEAGVPVLSVSKSFEYHSYWSGFFQSHKFSRTLRMTFLQSVALILPAACPESLCFWVLGVLAKSSVYIMLSLGRFFLGAFFAFPKYASLPLITLLTMIPLTVYQHKIVLWAPMLLAFNRQAFPDRYSKIPSKTLASGSQPSYSMEPAQVFLRRVTFYTCSLVPT